MIFLSRCEPFLRLHIFGERLPSPSSRIPTLPPCVALLVCGGRRGCRYDNVVLLIPWMPYISSPLSSCVVSVGEAAARRDGVRGSRVSDGTEDEYTANAVPLGDHFLLSHALLPHPS